MKKFVRGILIITLVFIAACIVKLDVYAEKIWNTNGEKTPSGTDFTYKYWDGYGWTYCGDGTAIETIDITYDVTYCYEEAYKMLEYVNKIRRDAGVPELIMKDELMDVAMERAAECCIYGGHIRPDGSSPNSLSYFIDGENIHMARSTAEYATESLKNSTGHYETMVDPDYKYVGFGCVDDNSGGAWVQIFSYEDKYYEDGYDYKNPSNNKPVQWDKMTCYKRNDYTESFTAQIEPSSYWIEIQLPHKSYFYTDNVINPKIYLYHTYRNHKQSICLDAKYAEYILSVNSNLRKQNDDVKLVSSGNAVIEASLKDYPQLKASKEFTIKKNSFKVNGNTYKILDFDHAKLELTKAAKNKKSIKIPEKIEELPGRDASDEYTVVSIGSKAFKNNKKVKSITVGSKVEKIGKEAFRGCKNLKKLTINSKKLTSVGKNALKGVNKKAAIRVPKSKLKKYKTLFKGKGQKKSVKIKKK